VERGVGSQKKKSHFGREAHKKGKFVIASCVQPRPRENETEGGGGSDLFERRPSIGREKSRQGNPIFSPARVWIKKCLPLSESSLPGEKESEKGPANLRWENLKRTPSKKYML